MSVAFRGAAGKDLFNKRMVNYEAKCDRLRILAFLTMTHDILSHNGLHMHAKSMKPDD